MAGPGKNKQTSSIQENLISGFNPFEKILVKQEIFPR